VAAAHCLVVAPPDARPEADSGTGIAMNVLVITDDHVGPVMAGSALRAWELSCALDRAGHRVRLAAAAGSSAPADDGPMVVGRPDWRWADAVISPPWSLAPRAFVPGHVLVADGITPLLAELDTMPPTALVRHRQRTAAARVPLVAARADAILTGGPAQVEWWSSRVRGRFGLPFLTVPFGIPDRPPPPTVGEIPSVPENWAVVLWWGGVWPWLDLDTLLAARARLGRSPISIVVPTSRRPGRGDPTITAADLEAMARRHGLGSPQVVALETWIPYRERYLMLNRASLVAVLHTATEESALSFRTRALDAIWAGVPVLVTAGGEVARQARARGWGGVVPAGDPRACAAAMGLLLTEREQARCRIAIARDRERLTWSRVTRPVVDLLPRLPSVRRGALVPAAVRAALVLAGRRGKAANP
jgi:hypothetical protein